MSHDGQVSIPWLVKNTPVKRKGLLVALLSLSVSECAPVGPLPQNAYTGTLPTPTAASLPVRSRQGWEQACFHEHRDAQHTFKFNGMNFIACSELYLTPWLPELSVERAFIMHEPTLSR